MFVFPLGHVRPSHTLISLSEANTVTFLTHRENVGYKIPQLSPRIRSSKAFLPVRAPGRCRLVSWGLRRQQPEAGAAGLLLYFLMILPYRVLDRRTHILLQFHNLIFTE